MVVPIWNETECIKGILVVSSRPISAIPKSHVQDIAGGGPWRGRQV